MTITAKEVKTVDGFVLDGTPQSIKIDQSQSPQRMTFWNERQGALIINKLSSLDRKTPLEGGTFKITTATGEFVPDENGKISYNGLYYTDENGQIILKGVTGTLVVTEEKSISGYTIDGNTRTQTVVVNPNDTQSLYFYNAPIGGLELVKVNAADKTQRIPNTTFEIRRVSDGGLVDTVTTGTDGRVYVPLESGSYILAAIICVTACSAPLTATMSAGLRPIATTAVCALETRPIGARSATSARSAWRKSTAPPAPSATSARMTSCAANAIRDPAAV